MSDKPQTTWPFAMPEFASLLNASTLFDIQRRNMQALTQAASKVSEAMTLIANKEMAAFSALRAIPIQIPTTEGSVADFVGAQFHAGHEAIEKSISELRDFNDTVRQCWYEVAQEFEACVRDNISSIEGHIKQSATNTKRVVPVQRAKAAAE